MTGTDGQLEVVSGGREGIVLCTSDFYLEFSMEATTETEYQKENRFWESYVEFSVVFVEFDWLEDIYVEDIL